MARYERSDLRKAREWLTDRLTEQNVLHAEDFTTGSYAPPRKVQLQQAMEAAISHHAHAGSILTQSSDDTILLNMLKRVQPEITRETLSGMLDDCVQTMLGIDTKEIEAKWAALVKSELDRTPVTAAELAKTKAGKPPLR